MWTSSDPGDGVREQGTVTVKVLRREQAQAGFLGTEVSRNERFQGNDHSWVESSEAGEEWRSRQGLGSRGA